MNSQSLADRFPFTEDYCDFAGRPRTFQISLRKTPLGDFFVEATEVSAEQGYRFQVHSTIYSDPALASALGDLRAKIRQRLATRYLSANRSGNKELTHSELYGRISNDGLVVDGSLLNFDELKSILTTHEGLDIRIVIGE